MRKRVICFFITVVMVIGLIPTFVVPVYAEAVPHEHSFSDNVYMNNGNGTHSRKCIDCDEYGAIEDHTYVDGVCVCGDVKPFEGTGSKDNPYLIEGLSQLNVLAENTKKNGYEGYYFKLTNDIGELNTDGSVKIGFESSIGHSGQSFNGCFDGAGHTVVLDISLTDSANSFGLIGKLGGSGVVCNVNTVGTVVSKDATTMQRFAGVCGLNNGGRIENCINKASVIGGANSVNYAGVCGENHGIILECKNIGMVNCNSGSSSAKFGGICGYSTSGEINACTNEGDIIGNAVVTKFAGICGLIESGTIKNCTNTALISGAKDSSDFAGICGHNSKGNIENCVNSGDIISEEKICDFGGICGYQNSGAIRNCASYGNVNGGKGSYNYGGVCGNKYGSALFENCYYDNQTASGLTAVCNITDTENVCGISTALAKASTGTEGALIDKLNGYKENDIYPASWYKWVTTSDGYPYLQTNDYYGVSLSLGSDIYVNFYIDLAEDALNNGTMSFTINGHTVQCIKKTTENGICFSCPVTVLEINEDIKATFEYNYKTYTKIYSVARYIEHIIFGQDQEGNSYPEEAKTLVKKIANYGHYTQLYLKELHKFADDKYEEIENYGGVYDVNPQNADFDYSFTKPDPTDNLSLYGTSVYFDSATSLNYYVTVNGGVRPTAVCTGNKNVDIKLYRDNIYIVSVKDIIATEIATEFTVTVSLDEENILLTGSVLDYCGAVIHKEGQTENAINSMVAFYEYHLAALAYVAVNK